MPVLVVTLVSFLETASSAKVDHQKGGTRWNENQDLIAHGMAKISAGLCGSFATSASFSRSAINLYAGARSGWATLFATGVVFFALLWLTPALHHVPTAVLAAVVVAAIVDLSSAGARAFLVAHFARRGRDRDGHICTHAGDCAAAVLGRSRRRADEPHAFSLPATASAHHRGGPAFRWQLARSRAVASATNLRHRCLPCAWTPSSISPLPAHWSSA